TEPKTYAGRLPLNFTVAFVKPVPNEAAMLPAETPVPAVKPASFMVASPDTAGIEIEAATPNGALLELPPPGVGLVTVMVALPAEARSAALAPKINSVELIISVLRGEPFQRTIAPGTKFVPHTVTAALDPPVTAPDGATCEIE